MARPLFGAPVLVGTLSWDHAFVRRTVPLVSIIQASLVFLLAEEAKKPANSN